MLSTLACLMLLVSTARADEACTADKGKDIVAALGKAKAIDPALQPALQYTYSRVPLGGPMQVAISGKSFASETDRQQYARFRVLVVANPRETDAPANFTEGVAVSPTAASPENPLVKKLHLIASGDLLLDFMVPSVWDGPKWGWHEGRLVVIACDKTDKVIFTSSLNTTLTDWWTCALTAFFVTIVVYVLVGWGARAVENVNRTDKFDRPFDYIDPVQLTSGPNGKGSVSRLQILYFTVIIFFILLYLLLRIGLLSDMSNTVLLLLGISAVGAAAAKATDVSQNRLAAENWSWLVSRKWLPPHGLISMTRASWRDLVTADDGFDVYHFQMLIFSLVLGLALLQTGFEDLAHFEVPEALLGVLGLSQTVFIGGKLVSSPACSDLDKAVTELRKRETALAAAVRETQVPLAGTPELAKAKAAEDTARDAFGQQMQLVKTYFPDVLGDLPNNADFSAHQNG